MEPAFPFVGWTLAEWLWYDPQQGTSMLLWRVINPLFPRTGPLVDSGGIPLTMVQRSSAWFLARLLPKTISEKQQVPGHLMRWSQLLPADTRRELKGKGTHLCLFIPPRKSFGDFQLAPLPPDSRVGMEWNEAEWAVAGEAQLLDFTR